MNEDIAVIAQELIALMEELLPIRPIQAEDHILVLGASSLQAIQFANDVSSKYGIPFQMNQLFKLKSILEIAAYISHNQKGSLLL